MVNDIIKHKLLLSLGADLQFVQSMVAKDTKNLFELKQVNNMWMIRLREKPQPNESKQDEAKTNERNEGEQKKEKEEPPHVLGGSATYENRDPNEK